MSLRHSVEAAVAEAMKAHPGDPKAVAMAACKAVEQQVDLEGNPGEVGGESARLEADAMTTCWPALINSLNLESAGSDTVRAGILEALKSYGAQTGQLGLVDAARAALPKAHPWRPPAEWCSAYLAQFRETADPDCGVDPGEAERYCGEYWLILTDEQRQERLANPRRLGEEDGETDAENLNKA